MEDEFKGEDTVEIRSGKLNIRVNKETYDSVVSAVKEMREGKERNIIKRVAELNQLAPSLVSAIMLRQDTLDETRKRREEGKSK